MKNLIILNAIFLVILNLVVIAQSPEIEKPKLKNFGWSLEKGSEKENQPFKDNKADDDVIRVETNLVINDLLVTDKQGRSIMGLTKDNFVVTEDNQPQSIATFSLGDNAQVPRSIVLILDYSGSMLPYIKTSIEAAKSLVDQLNPKDRMAIVTDDVELLTGFTRDKSLLKEKLESLKTKALSGKPGRSEQYSALYAVLNEIFDGEDIRPIIFFQTDGDEYFALKDGRPLSVNSPIKQRDFSFDDILSAAEKARTTVYTIIPGMKYAGLKESEQLDKAKKEDEIRRATLVEMKQNLPAERIAADQRKIKDWYKMTIRMSLARLPNLNSLSQSTGGWTSMLEMPEQAESVYAKILAGINRRYVFGYYPTNETRDGKRRVVKIEVRNHPEYIVWGRKTYIAPQK